MNGTRGGKPPKGRPVIERAFDLLGGFDAEHRALLLADLARRAAMPRSSALRLARQLMATGALEQLADGRYAVGLRMLEIASLAPRGHGLREAAMPSMEDLFHVTRQHVLLAVRDGAEALLVERLSTHDPSPVDYRIGGRLPLATTGVGQVLLAFAPTPVQEHAISTFVPDGDVRTADDLRRTLAEVRRGDFALGSRTTMATAAAPVRGPDGVVAAVSVVAPREQFAGSAYVPAVRAAARAISRQLTGAW